MCYIHVVSCYPIPSHNVPYVIVLRFINLLVNFLMSCYVYTLLLGKLCKAGTTGYYQLVKDKVPEVTVDSDINEWV
jgi:hypothetical protein